MQREEWNPHGCIFLGYGEGDDYVELEKLLELHNSSNAADPTQPKIAALFTEFPSNPLLKSPDLARIMRLAQQYDFLVAVDDTISSFANVNLMTGPGSVDYDIDS
jgi:cystathionine gamma-synthase